ncbi:hypothetical protein ACLBWM_05685 [Acinetobacter radioresistens]
MTTQRYRVLGFICTNKNATSSGSEFLSQGKTIFQCNTLNEALSQVKHISEKHPECTRFSIERGEWL